MILGSTEGTPEILAMYQSKIAKCILEQNNFYRESHLLSSENKQTDVKTELLVLCQLFYPELVSTGQTLTELCEELVGLGVDVEVVCGPMTVINRDKKAAKCIEHKGIRIRRVWGTRFPKLHLIGRVINQITFAISTFFYLLFHHHKKPILVLTNPPFLAVICGILKLLKISGPYIYLVFDVYPDTAVRLGVLKENGLLSRLWEQFNTFVFKHASAIVVIGRCMEEVIMKKMKNHNLTPNGKLHCISICSECAKPGLPANFLKSKPGVTIVGVIF